MTKDVTDQVKKWLEIEEASRLVRDSQGERRKQIINEIYVPLLKRYNLEYGRYDALNKPL